MSEIPGQAPPGNPPADGGTPPAAPPVNESWWSKIEDQETRGYAEKKNFKDPETLLRSYRDFEKFQGVPQDRLLKLPETPEAPEWAGIREKLGFAPPAKPEDYGLPVPDGMDPAFANQAAQWLHGAGVPKEMATKIVGPWNEFVAGQMKADAERIQAEDAKEVLDLKSEWGAQYDGSVEMARRAAKEMGGVTGLDQKALDDMEFSMGPRAFLKLWAAIGSKTQGEGRQHGENTNQGSLSPDLAKLELQSLKTDIDFGKKLERGDAAAVAKFNRLSAIAAGMKPE